MGELFKHIHQYMDGHHDEMLALWKEMVGAESGPHQLEGMTAMDDILHREPESMGAKVWVFPVENAGGILMVEQNNGSPKVPLLLVGHVDTVLKGGTTEDNPFRIDEQGRAHGPGALDMEADPVIVVHTIKALAVAGFTGRPVKYVFTGDKESLHMPSNTEQVMTGEIEGTATTSNFETDFLDSHLVVGRKSSGPVPLMIHDVSTHSGSVPEKGRSAVLETAHKVVALEACNGTPRGKLINYGKTVGGIGESTIPDPYTISIGVRFPSTKIKNEIPDILGQATSHSTAPDTQTELSTSRLMKCMDTTGGVMALSHHIQRTAVRCDMNEPGCFQVGGLSGSDITVVCGIPTTCVMSVRGEGNHIPTEYAEVESFFEHCILAACAAGSLENGSTEQ